jgi:hypothetical protein
MGFIYLFDTPVPMLYITMKACMVECSLYLAWKCNNINQLVHNKGAPSGFSEVFQFTNKIKESKRYLVELRFPEACTQISGTPSHEYQQTEHL